MVKEEQMMRKTWRGSKKIKPFGLEKAKKLAEKHHLEFYGDYVNRRQCHCKACGSIIFKGEGNQWYYWYGEMKCRHYDSLSCNCGWYYSSHYICGDCHKKLGGKNS